MDYYRPGEGIQMMVSCAQQDIKTIKRENENLRLKVEELEEKNRRLEEARENANAACAKWEGLYRAELEEKAAWVSVKDRLPETDGIYIVTACDEWCHYGEGIWYSTVVVCAEYYKGDWTWYEGSQEYSLEGIVTHWMPLPEPPKEV